MSTKTHLFTSIHIMIQESLLSCLIRKLVPKKDFLLYLVDQTLSGYVMAHHPDMLQDQQMPLLWLHGSFSQYLYETLAKTRSYAGWLDSPFLAVGLKMPQLTLTVWFSKAGLKAEYRNSCFSVTG